LVGASEDRGCVGLVYAGSFLGKPRNEIHLRSPLQPSAGHQLLVWQDLSKDPRIIPSSAISGDSEGLVWKLPELGAVTALAVSYEGACIGSYWKEEALVGTLKRACSSKLFALLRWMKIPVLKRSLKAPMSEAVLRSPSDFVSGWFDDPPGLVQRQAEQGVELVVRSFLWNYNDKNEAMTDRIARAFPRSDNSTSRSEVEAFKSGLLLVGAVCPSLGYSLASRKLRGPKYAKYVRAASASMLRQPEMTDLASLQVQLATERGECANLIGGRPEALESAVNAFGIYLDGQGQMPGQTETDLRILGEFSRGPLFITASLLLRLLSRSRF
jgi:hypothetical protein